MGRILGVPGRASPHIFQMLLLEGLPKMTLSARPALTICLADSLIKSCAAGRPSSHQPASASGRVQVFYQYMQDGQIMYLILVPKLQLQVGVRPSL